MDYLWLSLGLIIWFYFLSVLKRAQLNAYYFLAGVVGILFIVLLFRNNLIFVTSHFLCIEIDKISRIIPIYSTNINRNVIAVRSVKLPITYELSAFLESLFFESLLLFFPVYRFFEKVILSIVGITYIFIINLIRILLMVLTIYYLGSKFSLLAILSFYRFFLYIAILILFYMVFTRPQIIRGNVNYIQSLKRK